MAAAAGTAELVFAFLAKDQVSDTAKKVGKNIHDLTTATGKLNAASRLISAGAIIAFGASSVKAFAEAEKSQVRLEQAFKRFPALADTNIESLRGLNQALQDKTGADADSLAAAQASLAQFKLTGEQIEQLTPLLVDYAQTTGQDVTTAATSLGRAFMGNTRALKAIGVDFKATGDTAKDFQGIMGALEAQVGGAGEAFGQTTAGQLQILQASFEDLQEEVGAQLVPALKALVSVAKPILGAFGQLPEPVKAATVAAGALTAGVLLLGPRVLALSAALKTVLPAGGQAAAGLQATSAAAATTTTTTTAAATAVRGFATSMAAIVGAGAAAVAAIGVLGEANKVLQDRLGNGAKSAEQWGEAFASGAETADLAQLRLDMMQVAGQSGTLAAAIKNLGTGDIIGAWTAWRTGGENVANFDKAMADLVGSGNIQGAERMVAQLGLSVDDARGMLPQYSAALDAAGSSSSSLADATVQAADSMSTLKDMIDDLRGTQMSSEKAFMKVQEAIDKATEAANENGKSVDMNTEAGRRNRSALQDMATAALDAAAAYAENGESQDTVKLKTQQAREAFIAVARQMGVSADKAGELADQYGLIPDRVATTVVASGVSAVNTALRTTVSQLDALDGRTVFVTINQRTVRVPVATGGYIRGYDYGGPVVGPGTGTSDSVPAMLSNGEYVIRAAAVSRIGVDLLDDINDNGVIDAAAAGRRVVSRAVSAADARAAENINIRTQILLDGKQLAEALANYKRSIGGRKLGLD